MNNVQGSARGGETLAGKYMTFQVADEIYGVGILEVREIVGLMKITHMPRAPRFLRGVVNLRGRIIPILDLRLQLGHPAAADTGQSVIIVVQCQAHPRPLTMGVLVDQVLEVLDLPGDRIEPPPDVGVAGQVHRDFILGVGKAPGHVVFLLDISRILSGGDAAAASGVAP